MQQELKEVKEQNKVCNMLNIIERSTFGDWSLCRHIERCVSRHDGVDYLMQSSRRTERAKTAKQRQLVACFVFSFNLSLKRFPTLLSCQF